MRTRKAIDVLCYLLHRLEWADKIKLQKLVYLVDKYHLIHYGRSVTGDQYFAMEHGPVASRVRDILNFRRDVLRDDFDYLSQRVIRSGDFGYEPGEACDGKPTKYLSRTDIEALDFVLTEFGKKNQWELRDYTHDYQEWKQYEDLIKSGKKRVPLEIEELLSVLGDDDPIGASKEHIEESKKYLTGTYD